MNAYCSAGIGFPNCHHNEKQIRYTKVRQIDAAIFDPCPLSLQSSSAGATPPLLEPSAPRAHRMNGVGRGCGEGAGRCGSWPKCRVHHRELDESAFSARLSANCACCRECRKNSTVSVKTV